MAAKKRVAAAPKNRKAKTEKVRDLVSHEIGLVELGSLILKEKGVSEGLWMPFVRFNISAGMGAHPGKESTPLPSVISSVAAVGVREADENTPESLRIDASALKKSKGSKRA